MRYWVYINDKVDGPYEEDKLVTLPGFTPDTLICSEEVEEGGGQEWVKASNVFEFDHTEPTLNRPLNGEELLTIRTNQPFQTGANTPDVSALLLEKLDYLTKEIESLKGKLDEALSAAAIAAATAQQKKAESVSPKTDYDLPDPTPIASITLTNKDFPVADSAKEEDASVTNTDSLVSAAESMVAHAGAENLPGEESIASDLTDELSNHKDGDEVVLRSAMEALYSPKEETEEEKESTFQDLLSAHPDVKEALQTLSGKAAGEAMLQSVAPEEKPVEQNVPSEQEAQKEAVINEITGAAQAQPDVLEQAIAEKTQEAQTVSAAPAEAEGVSAAPAQAEGEDLELQIPQALEEPAPQEEPAEKQDLDLGNTQNAPGLSIKDIEPDLAHVAEQADLPVAEEPQQQPVEAFAQDKPAGQNVGGMDALRNMGSTKDPTDMSQPMEDFHFGDAAEQDPQTETVQELVPGPKVEDNNDQIISQADLAAAFTERQTERNPFDDQALGGADAFGTTAEAAQAQNTPAEAPKMSDLSEAEEAPAQQVNPNELTEVQLQEGSTYLISDFIPPAEANAIPKELKDMEAVNRPDLGQKVEGVSEAVTSEEEKDAKEEKALEATMIEEVKGAQDAGDVTVSKIILENTIKTKRGASLDLKTVPMVKEPSQTERLDLSDSELENINLEHELKAADLKTSGGSAKKIVGFLALIVIVIVIYVMLAFLNLIPPSLNFISKAPAVATAEQEEQLNEMLGGVSAEPSAPPQQAAPAAPPAGMPAAGVSQQPAVNPLKLILDSVKAHQLANGMTLQQLINSKHTAVQSLIQWSISPAVEADNYSILVKIPPDDAQGFKITYRFNYNTITRTLEPTISDSKNLLDSI